MHIHTRMHACTCMLYTYVITTSEHPNMHINWSFIQSRIVVVIMGLFFNVVMTSIYMKCHIVATFD